MLEKTLESPLDCKKIQPLHPKGDQSWVFIGRSDIEAETPILWPPDAKSWLIWKDPDAGTRLSSWTERNWVSCQDIYRQGHFRWAEQDDQRLEGRSALGMFEEPEEEVKMQNHICQSLMWSYRLILLVEASHTTNLRIKRWENRLHLFSRRNYSHMAKGIDRKIGEKFRLSIKIFIQIPNYSLRIKKKKQELRDDWSFEHFSLNY